MDNLTTTISFSIYSNKGIYALLLGSGVSKTSGIPTGWDIVIDLIKELAALKKEECLPNPEKWFKEKYKEEPDYSTILSKLVATPSERVNFLKPYFEPTEQEREQNLKLPTTAHKTIAKLIKDGYIKVVITTNFDRLLEKALQIEGIEPTIIRHSNDIDGAMPLVHNDFTLIKINGDYLDSRFLNTKEELAKYDAKLHNYLLRIINEYGIISCGWSAKWDSGLINIIRQSENYRFASYWTYVGKCENELSEISNHRKGQTLKIASADSFLNDIYENIKSLETINDNHPLNADIAIARLKTYIVKDDNKIQLYDLLFNQRELVYKNIRQIIDFSLYPNKQNLLPVLSRYETSLDILLPLVINGVYWCKPENYSYFVDIISRFAEPPPDFHGSHYKETKNLYYYPSMLLLYSLGITAIKTRKFELLTTCFQLKIAELQSEHSSMIYLLEKVNPCAVDDRIMNDIISKSYTTPLSTYLSQKLRSYFQIHIINDVEYNDLFDVFEYLLCINFMYLIDKYGRDWAPWGQFLWRNRGIYKNKTSLLDEFLTEAEIKKGDWLPLKYGMFDSDYNKFSETKNRLDTFYKGISVR